MGITVDATGNIYVADTGNNAIRQITVTPTSCQVSTLAGNGTAGSADGKTTAATFYQPEYLTLDASGNLYVTDTINNKIRMVTTLDGNVSTVAGNGTAGNTNGGTNANFTKPTGISVDETTGALYVAEYDDIREIAKGAVSTLAGSPYNPTVSSCTLTDGLGTNAIFCRPYGMAIDGYGNLYVADSYNNAVRKVSITGNVTTIAGTGEAGADDGPGNTATFYQPRDIAIEKSGVVYVTEPFGHRIRMLTPSTP
ncbi:MAG: hypothetical protein FWD69_14340 [Polyangiaceae bacterium]|nr:hypothetical protein [Polyangiaceae bacterium]